MLKTTPPRELTAAVRACAAGETTLGPTVIARLVDSYVARPAAADLPALSNLTPRETEVLLRVAQGYSNKEIAAQLEISVKTVETHKLRSMDKLGLRSRADVVQFALHRGWLSPT